MANTTKTSEFDGWTNPFVETPSAGEFSSWKNPFSSGGAGESRGFSGTSKDVGLSLLSGTTWVPQSIVGMADLITTPLRAGYEALTGSKQQTFTQSLKNLGVDFVRAQKAASELKTDQSQKGRQDINQAFEEGGIFDGLKALGSNPMIAVESAAESVPSMLTLAGGVRLVALRIYSAAAKSAPTAALAKKAGKEAVKAAMPRLATLSSALEGGQAAGMQAYDYAQDGTLSPREAMSSVGAGASTAAIGVLSNKVGRRFGLEDAEAALGAGSHGNTDGLVKRAAKGALKEGLLEEPLSQSLSGDGVIMEMENSYPKVWLSLAQRAL